MPSNALQKVAFCYTRRPIEQLYEELHKALHRPTPRQFKATYQKSIFELNYFTHTKTSRKKYRMANKHDFSITFSSQWSYSLNAIY